LLSTTASTSTSEVMIVQYYRNLIITIIITKQYYTINNHCCWGQQISVSCSKQQYIFVLLYNQQKCICFINPVLWQTAT